ncbi:MAG: hypothetical protein IJS53_03440 [Clostridia bacterium]|nr:hypothetical protein [Clostridia bacterium]
MCTGFIYKGNDVIFGYNFDLTDGAWDFGVYPRKDMFFVGIKVNGRLYKTHGVNGNGQFGCLPYMNAPEYGAYRRGGRRLDLLVNDYIGGKLDYDDALAAIQARPLVNAPGANLHALFGDAQGRMLLAEPGLGWREMREKYAAVTNFPLLLPSEKLNPALGGWYGVERRQTVCGLLEQAGENMGLEEAMEILRAARLTDGAPTRVSFAYSMRERAVLYALKEENWQPRRITLETTKG